ncbi:hypothetical protein A1019T_01879 [Psychrobacter pasteurii]|uniref:Uncharacterized protein n=1 Tax=Psychrobacter pasteurii TaxID=1945520 RepID=A0A1R4EHG9_9GAMM|nr:tetratricopeptide repeat protein [Psychrobacter pasteurii]SJM37894.1 hypothetical protein A1019T_01879 [Psychrobacter pasteurii]
MSKQSRVPVTALAKTSIKVSPLKSLLMSSALSLLMMGALTGCQSTGGLSVPSSVPVTQPNAQSNQGTAPAPSSTPSSTTYSDGLEDDYPISEVDDDTQAVEQNTGFEPQTSYPVDNTPTQTEAPVTTEEAPVVTTNPNAVGQTRPTPSIPPSTTNESPVVKPRVPDTRTAQQSLLEQARQNSKQSSHKSASIQDGSNLPAFQRLMDTGVQQLRQGQVAAAQATFTRAQRLAPQSSAVYFYLGQVALKQNQPLKAEAMARRGLVVAQTEARKRALWQVILKAGQAQGNTRVINEAKSALSR